MQLLVCLKSFPVGWLWCVSFTVRGVVNDSWADSANRGAATNSSEWWLNLEGNMDRPKTLPSLSGERDHFVEVASFSQGMNIFWVPTKTCITLDTVYRFLLPCQLSLSHLLSLSLVAGCDWLVPAFLQEGLWNVCQQLTCFPKPWRILVTCLLWSCWKVWEITCEWRSKRNVSVTG